MIQNYFKIAWRHLIMNKVFSIIHIIGLGMSLSFVILVYLFIRHEFSYDSFHENKHTIFQIEHSALFGINKGQRSAISFFPLAPALLNNLPEVVRYSRYKRTDRTFGYGVNEQTATIGLVDKDFMKMFSFELLKGSPKNALDDPRNIVISEQIVNKYFKNNLPIGQLVTIEDKVYVVSGVMKNIAENSSIKADIFVRLENEFNKGSQSDWHHYSVMSYIQVREDASKNLEEKVNSLVQGLIPFKTEEIKQFIPDYSGGQLFQFHLVKLPYIHFSPADQSFLSRSSIVYSYLLGGVTVLILTMACSNYVLLSLAGASSRLKEIGIRKVMGAGNGMVRKQFLCETFLITFISMVLGITLVQLLLPQFNFFVQKQLSFDLLSEIELVYLLSVIIFLVSMLAGGYPAFWLANLTPHNLLKGKTLGPFNLGISNVLVGIQFIVCLFFMACVIGKQMKYISEKDLGFDRSQVVYINTSNHLDVSESAILQRFKNKLQNDPDILHISSISNFPYNNTNVIEIDEQVRCYANWFYVNYDWRATLGIKLMEGRDFSLDFGKDFTQSVIINESMVLALGLKEAVGTMIPGDSLMIIGVVQDFHYQSLMEKVQPTYFRFGEPSSPILIRMAPNHIPQAIGKIGDAWKELIADQPLNYTFLDEMMDEHYAQIKRWQSIVTYATLFGTLIAGMGLFGLSGFYITSRFKEIALRKVYGADIGSILMLLNQSIVKIVLLSAIVATAIAVYVMNDWLQNFAYRIELKWYWLAEIVLFGFFVVFTTIGYHIIKASRINPAKILRNE